MKKIILDTMDPDTITKDMILAMDIIGPSGNILLNKGAGLTMALIRRLKNWGITYIYIEGEEVQVEKTQAVTINSDTIQEQLKKKFADHLNNPIMNDFFNAVYNFQKKRNMGL